MKYAVATYVGILGFRVEGGGHFWQVSVCLQYSEHYIISAACYTKERQSYTLYIEF
jgi:hypothetical protein